MSYCVNRSLEGFKNLVEKSGLSTALMSAKVSAWMEENQTYDLPTLEALGISPSLVGFNWQKELPETVKAFAEDLSRRFGITYKIISEKQAREIFPQYSYQPAFYTNKTAYLVDGIADRISAIHEIFGHPFLDIIEKENRPLFENLLRQALANKEVVEYVKSEYAHLFENGVPSSDAGKEAIIRAIELDAKGKLNDKPLIAAIRRFWAAIQRRLKQAFRIDQFDPKMSISDLTNFILSDQKLDLSKAESIAKIRLKQSTLQDRIFDSIRSLNREVRQEMKNGIETYIKGNSTYERVTEFTTKFDYNPKSSEEIDLWVAERDFATQGLTKDQMIADNGQKYTFDQYVDLVRMRNNYKRAYGQMGHLYMEWILGGDQARIKADIAMLERDIPGVRQGVADHEKRFGYIWKDSEIIRDMLGIQPEDKILTEQIVHSDTLGIASRIDALIIRPNGQVVLPDFKFGNIMSDEHTARIFKYAPLEAQTDLGKSKLNEARLQIVLRALMLKEQNPSLMFEDMFVAQMDRLSLVRSKETIKLQDYLTMIENFTKAENPAAFKTLTEKGLFNADNYWGKSTTLVDAASDVHYKNNPDGYVAKLYEELLILQNQIRRLDTDTKLTGEIKKRKKIELEMRRDEVMRIVLEMASPKSAQELFTVTEDISMPRTWLGTQYDVKNDLAQAYFAIVRERKEIARRKILENKEEYDKIASKLYGEYLTSRGLPNTGLTRGVNSLLGMGFKYFKGDGSGVYDFAFVKRDGNHGNGYYLRTPSDEGWDQLTEVQKEYLIFVSGSMSKQYKAATGKIVYSAVDPQDGFRTKTKAELLNRSAELEAGFFPRIPLQPSEFTERFGFNLKAMWKKFKEQVAQDYHQEWYSAQGDAVGIPLKGVGNITRIADIVGKADHSFDIESAYSGFMSNLYMMEELDEVLALGEGVKGWLHEQQNMDGSLKMRNLAKLVDNQIMLQITDIKPKTKWMSRYSVDKDGKRYVYNFDTLLLGLKNFTTYGSMWFQATNAAFNGGLIWLLNHKNAAVGDIAQSFAGIRKEDVDFDHASLLWSEKEFLQMKYDVAMGHGESNKMYRLLKHFNYMPDAYDYRIRADEKVIGKNKMIHEGTPMFMNAFVEDFGTVTVFGALMKHMKVETVNGEKVSVYDAYELVPDGKGGEKIQWRKDIKVRGVEATKTPGENATKQITELTTKEITKLKRASQRIHGAYRQDERSSADLYAVGKLIMQFKKYLPTQISNMFSTRWEDPTLGYYKPKIDPQTGLPQLIEIVDKETGEKRQETLLEWESRIHEGRAITFIKTIAAVGGILGKESAVAQLFAKFGIKITGTNTEYKWENLTPEQKQNVIKACLDLVFAAVTFLAYNLAFPDDDDKETLVGRRTNRLVEDMLEGVNPVDLTRMAKNPAPSITRAYNMVDASWDFLVNGILRGDRLENGNLPGATQLRKNIPIFSAEYNLNKVIEESLVIDAR